MMFELGEITRIRRRSRGKEESLSHHLRTRSPNTDGICNFKYSNLTNDMICMLNLCYLLQVGE